MAELRSGAHQLLRVGGALADRAVPFFWGEPHIERVRGRDPSQTGLIATVDRGG